MNKLRYLLLTIGFIITGANLYLVLGSNLDWGSNKANYLQIAVGVALIISMIISARKNH